MNTEKLQEIQGGLDAHIIKQHPEIAELENNDWKFLALQVELGELANEWRGFKVWSDDQDPRRKVYGTSKLIVVKEPLREEFVDGLHFILSLGNDLHIVSEKLEPMNVEFENITAAFLKVYDLVSGLQRNVRNGYGNNDKYIWRKLFFTYIRLGEMLGFTEKEIEEGYLAKNKKNHERQLTGY